MLSREFHALRSRLKKAGAALPPSWAHLSAARSVTGSQRCACIALALLLTAQDCLCVSERHDDTSCSWPLGWYLSGLILDSACRLAANVVDARQKLLSSCLADILAAAPPLAGHPALVAFLQQQVFDLSGALAGLHMSLLQHCHLALASRSTPWPHLALVHAEPRRSA